MKAIELNQFQNFLKPRDRAAHKGDFGHVLVIGGDYGYSGAAQMAGKAALRVGAGLVSIATRPEHAVTISAETPELMCHGIEEPGNIKPLLEKATVIVLGPGLGQQQWGQALFKLAIDTEKNMIIDADGLNLLAKKPFKKSHRILTPHPGEASRLLNQSREEIQSDRVQSIKRLQANYDGVIVLKGAGTLVQGPHEEPVICEAGNPGMASGGMGDILSGVLGGLVAQGVPLYEAAQLGVLIHALAGDLAARKNGERGLIATDSLKYLRRLVNGLVAK